CSILGRAVVRQAEELSDARRIRKYVTDRTKASNCFAVAVMSEGVGALHHLFVQARRAAPAKPPDLGFDVRRATALSSDRARWLRGLRWAACARRAIAVLGRAAGSHDAVARWLLRFTLRCFAGLRSRRARGGCSPSSGSRVCSARRVRPSSQPAQRLSPRRAIATGGSPTPAAAPSAARVARTLLRSHSWLGIARRWLRSHSWLGIARRWLRSHSWLGIAPLCTATPWQTARSRSRTRAALVPAIGPVGARLCRAVPCCGPRTRRSIALVRLLRCPSRRWPVATRRATWFVVVVFLVAVARHGVHCIAGAGARCSAPRRNATKRLDTKTEALQRKSGGDLLSQGGYPQVPSALAVFTSVFGMGTGVSPPLLPPEIWCAAASSPRRQCQMPF